MEIAEKLWQAGFRDINGLDEHCQRPLSMYRFSWAEFYYSYRDIGVHLVKEIELLIWFVEKGANIYSPIHCLDSRSEPTVVITDLHPEE